MNKIIEIDTTGFIDIDVTGTHYISVRYNPNTREIITTVKNSTSNCPPCPVKSHMNDLYNSLKWDEQFAKDKFTKKIKIIKRIDKIASQYRKQMDLLNL